MAAEIAFDRMAVNLSVDPHRKAVFMAAVVVALVGFALFRRKR
jgi:hypothetical protein